MSEQYWKRIHAPDAKPDRAKPPQHHHGKGEPSGGGAKYRPDLDLARKLFDGRDRRKTGYLDISALLSLAEEIWAAEHPGFPLLGRDSIKVSPPPLPPNTHRTQSFCGNDLISLRSMH
jgi:hypothetical protein